MIGHGLGPALASTGLLVVPAPEAARAHEDHAGQHGPGASPATLGEVHFPVTCSPEAQVRFDRAMTLQHSFWYQQAAQAFRSVHAADPSCTMALWGEAMTLLLNPFGAPAPQNLQ